ncbi:unnamed protein product [Prunus armeniaca]|uniref:Transposase MuDR plant domain-containing protein n=1 Tax=Prunus armeniaca TaxID=36596 RepID=A0A6J5VIT5_PRUAR|nr:unnamed protein product [Prunus armeniaca]
MSWDPRPPGEDDPIYDCMAVYLGHVGRIDYWYRVEDEGELKRMEFDSEVIQMCENVPEVRMINMYMDHRDNIDDVLNSQTDSSLPEFDKAIVVHDRLDKVTSNEVHKTRKPTPSMNSATTKGKAKVAAVDEGSLQHETNRDTSKGKQKVAAVDDECVQHDTTKARTKGKQNVAEVDEGFVDAEINEVRRSVRKRNPSIQQEADEADDADDSSKTDDESDPDFVDNEYGIDEDDDDEVFLNEVDIDGEWGGANAEQSIPKPSFVEDFVDNEDMYADSDEKQHLRRAPQSDEESTGHRFPEFNTSCDMGIVEFEVGMQFANSSSFKEALKAI